MDNQSKVQRILTVLKERFTRSLDISDVVASKQDDTFYSRALLPYVLSELTGLSDTVLVDSITDGGDDLGLDAILYNEPDKTLYLAQSKLIKNGKDGISRAEVNAFLEGIQKAVNNNLDDANAKIKSKIDEIQKALGTKDIELCLLLVHTGDDLQNKSEAPLSEKIEKLNSHYDEDWVSFKEFGLEKILEIIVNHETAVSVDVDIPLMQWNRVRTPHVVYYGAIEATVLAKWHLKYGKNLFAKNIRNFLGKGDVNSKIIETLKKDKASFLYLNNGVTVLCDELNPDKSFGETFEVALLKAKGVRIVNGAQTVGSIGTFAELHSIDDLTNAKVFIRVISLKGTDEQLGTKITIATNSQNSINLQDFATMDDVQFKLEKEIFKKFNRRYLRLRLSPEEMKENDITPEEVAFVLCCFEKEVRDSTQVKREKSSVWNNYNNPKSLYRKIFTQSLTAELVINLVEIGRSVDRFLKNKIAKTSDREKSFCISGDAFMLHFVLQTLSKKHIGMINDSFIKDELPNIEATLEETYQKIWTMFKTDDEFKVGSPARILVTFKKMEILAKKLNIT